MIQKFPLADKYKYRLACSGCAKPDESEGAENFTYYKLLVPINHHCAEDILLVAFKNQRHTVWTKIRNRPKDDKRKKRYSVPLCRFFMRKDKTCAVSCQFSHGKAEQFLWNWELHGKFSIDRFIQHNKMGKQNIPPEGTACPLDLKEVGTCNYITIY